jgi:hypothetical protein
MVRILLWISSHDRESADSYVGVGLACAPITAAAEPDASSAVAKTRENRFIADLSALRPTSEFLPTVPKQTDAVCPPGFDLFPE